MCSTHEHLEQGSAVTKSALWFGKVFLALGHVNFGLYTLLRKHTHPSWSTHPQQRLYSAPCVFLSLVHLRRAACGPEVRDWLFLLLLLPVSQNFYLIHYEPLVKVAFVVIRSIVGAVHLFRQQTWPLFQCVLWSCALHFDLLPMWLFPLFVCWLYSNNPIPVKSLELFERCFFETRPEGPAWHRHNCSDFYLQDTDYSGHWLLTICAMG